MSRRVPPSAKALKTPAESQPFAHVLRGAELNAGADQLSACPLDAALHRPALP